MGIDVDSESGIVSLPAMTLGAQQLDEFLQSLAVARRSLQPPVQQIPPNRLEGIEARPKMHVGVDVVDGTVNFVIRHSGFGWLGFELPMADAVWLRDNLVLVTPSGPSTGQPRH